MRHRGKGSYSQIGVLELLTLNLVGLGLSSEAVDPLRSSHEGVKTPREDVLSVVATRKQESDEDIADEHGVIEGRVLEKGSKEVGVAVRGSFLRLGGFFTAGEDNFPHDIPNVGTCPVEAEAVSRDLCVVG